MGDAANPLDDPADAAALRGPRRPRWPTPWSAALPGWVERAVADRYRAWRATSPPGAVAAAGRAAARGRGRRRRRHRCARSSPRTRRAADEPAGHRPSGGRPSRPTCCGRLGSRPSCATPTPSALFPDDDYDLTPGALRRPRPRAARTRSRLGRRQGARDPPSASREGRRPDARAYRGRAMPERLVVIGGDAGGHVRGHAGPSPAAVPRDRRPREGRVDELLGLRHPVPRRRRRRAPRRPGGPVAGGVPRPAPHRRPPPPRGDGHRRRRPHRGGPRPRRASATSRLGFDQLHVATGARPDPPGPPRHRPRPRAGRADPRRRQGARGPRPHLALPSRWSWSAAATSAWRWPRRSSAGARRSPSSRAPTS